MVGVGDSAVRLYIVDIEWVFLFSRGGCSFGTFFGVGFWGWDSKVRGSEVGWRDGEVGGGYLSWYLVGV